MNALRRAVLADRAAGPQFAKDGLLRSHRPGDAARGIDWRASARCGTLSVREPVTSTSVTWTAIVDDSASMTVPADDPPLRAARAAAAMWRECAIAGDAWLETGCRAPWTLGAALDNARRTLPWCSAVLCVSDFYDLEALAGNFIVMMAARFCCVALVVGERWHAPNGCVRIRDAESGRWKQISLGAHARIRYGQASRERERLLCAALRSSGWRAAVLERDPATALRQAFALE